MVVSAQGQGPLYGIIAAVFHRLLVVVYCYHVVRLIWRRPISASILWTMTAPHAVASPVACGALVWVDRRSYSKPLCSRTVRPFRRSRQWS
jgi:hypothetical protein